MHRNQLGHAFGWVWTAYIAATAGTWLGFGAFPLIAVKVLGASPAEMSVIAATGPAVGAVLSAPLGPWLDRRRKRRVMIISDAARCVIMLSIPAAYFTGLLTLGQLVVASAVNAAANIAFAAASGAYLKSIVRRDQLLVAHGRFESTQWAATAIGPPTGGAAIGLFGPTVTVLANATGFLMSALAIGAIRDDPEPGSTAQATTGSPTRRLASGWRFIARDAQLRALLLNTACVNGLIMATEPLLAVLLLQELGWPAWQYGLAFGVPCLGGFLGSWLAARLEERFGRRHILLASGVLRALPPVALCLTTSGPGGVILVIVTEFVLISSAGVFNPLLATERLERIPDHQTGSVLLAWRATTTAAIALVTALWGVIATLTSSRIAIGLAGTLLLATPLLLISATRRVPGRVPSSAQV